VGAHRNVASIGRGRSHVTICITRLYDSVAKVQKRNALCKDHAIEELKRAQESVEQAEAATELAEEKVGRKTLP
jgi:hypothetical protein